MAVALLLGFSGSCSTCKHSATAPWASDALVVHEPNVIAAQQEREKQVADASNVTCVWTHQRHKRPQAAADQSPLQLWLQVMASLGALSSQCDTEGAN